MGKTEVFKALSDPVRREILSMLKEQGRLSAGAIAYKFDMSGATISYHLRMLKKADLVTESKEKTFVYYQLNVPVLEEARRWMQELEPQ